MRRTLHVVGTLMVVAGLLVLAWAVTVWRWQDPFTALLHEREQRSLERSYDRRVDASDLPQLPARPSATKQDVRVELPATARQWRRSSKRGDPIARLRIPRLGISEIVVNGTDAGSLKRGPGRYLGTAMPGEGELVYVAGHRTTYGAPFAQIDRLKAGDRVFVELPYGTFEYAITGHRIVAASELSVLKSKGIEQLALQACHPRFFASHRWIAYAKPVGITPPGTTEQTPLEATGS
jgi:sortase A